MTDQGNTGWTVFDSRGTLKLSENTIDFGYHQDNYQLNNLVFNTADWRTEAKGTLNSSSKGNTQTQAIYLQDKWQIDPHWALTFGAREEFWEASNGQNRTTLGTLKTSDYQKVTSTKFSPKISLNYEPVPAWGFRAAYGKAYRFPTVTEMYQQLTTSTNNIIQNNPNLKPEEVNSAELTAERRFANGLIRLTYFNEHRYDALISQTVDNNLASLSTCPNDGTTKQCTFTQNVDHLRVQGVELASEWQDFLISKLDLHANATFTSSKVLQDALAPSYVGKVVNRLPNQLYKVVATYHVDDKLTMTLAGRFSGHQYINLLNDDINSDVYKSASRFLFVDVKANYKFSDRWTASVGIDNINNDKAYVSHPYPQRTGYLQMKFDY